jgi:hypothetical protein
MQLQLKRVILFTNAMDAMTAFYRDVIGLPIFTREIGWVEFDAGACRIALHDGPGQPGKRPPKLVFEAKDVAAARALLVRRGAKGMGPVMSTSSFDMCNGKDPDGNPIQLSSRP